MGSEDRKESLGRAGRRPDEPRAAQLPNVFKRSLNGLIFQSLLYSCLGSKQTAKTSLPTTARWHSTVSGYYVCCTEWGFEAVGVSFRSSPFLARDQIFSFPEMQWQSQQTVAQGKQTSPLLHAWEDSGHKLSCHSL